MEKIFLMLAPHVLWLFVIAVPIEVIKNFREKQYQSGSLFAWGMRLFGYAVFGVYSFLIHEHIVAATQVFAALSVIFIFLQYLFYKKKALL